MNALKSNFTIVIVFLFASAWLVGCGKEDNSKNKKPLTKAEKLAKLPGEERLKQRFDDYILALNTGDVGTEGRYMPDWLLTNFGNKSGMTKAEFLTVLREANVENRNNYEETIWKGDIAANPIEASSAGDRKYKIIPIEILSRPTGRSNCIVKRTMDIFAMTNAEDWYFVQIRNNHIHDVFKETYKSLEFVEFQPTSSNLEECR